MTEEKDDIFSDVNEIPSVENTDTTVKDVIREDAPEKTSPEWNDFVMSKFDADELVEGMPTAAGLRRVAEVILGPIQASFPEQVFPTADPYRGTVSWKVVFESGYVFGDVGDVNADNTDDKFLPYAMATAATRAEARALRKALRLKKCASEEVTTEKDTAALARKAKPKAVSDGEYDESEAMTKPQENFIETKLNQLDIDGQKFFVEILGLNPKRKVTKQQATKAIETLNSFQTKSREIPDSIQGYKQNWRDK